MSTLEARAESLLAIDYQEVDVVSTAQEWTPLYTALSMPWREAQPDGTYSGFGLWETFWSNGHKVFFNEVGENVRLFKVNGAVASTTEETVVFDSTDGLIANAVLKNPLTDEMFLVKSVDSSTSAELARWYGTSAAVNIADDTVLYFVTTTLPAWTASIDAVTVAATEVDNEIQKIVTTVKQTDYVDYLKQNPNVKSKLGWFMKTQLNEHGKRIELAMLLGQKHYDSSTKQGTMEWVLELTKRSGNYADLSGGITKANVLAALGTPFKYGNPQTRIALCGAGALDKIGLLFEDRLQVGKIENSSLKFSSLELTWGETVRFIRHRNMDTNTALNGHMLILDPTQIQVVYQTWEDLNGKALTGKTQVIPNPASNYANTIVDIVTRVSLKNANAKAHSLIKLA